LIYLILVNSKKQINQFSVICLVAGLCMNLTQITWLKQENMRNKLNL